MKSSKQEMKQQPKPVIVLTGFLGSGKTTLLNAILQHKRQTRFAIIENEVGEVGIDGELIMKNTDSFAELNNGCICCTINRNFTDTLKKMTERNDWDELIIEATGIANPGGIITPFKQFPWLQKYFQLPQVICIADAQNIKEQLEVSDTTASQLAYGDKIYISKTDQVTGEIVAQTEDLIKIFNPFAKLFNGSKGAIPVVSLLEKRISETHEMESNPEKKAHHHHEHFEAVSLIYEESFDENKLYSRLYTFLMLQSSSVYRFKGIFYDTKKENRMVVQSAMQSLFMEEGEAWKEEEQKVSKFVFIGKNLKEKGFDKMLKSCLS